ncbi:MAG: hypothetical protein HCA25_26355 [Dolichospermum sp. DET50]|nr:hypothetical protein [Dolichospermum sp. DET66]MBS3035646.1 hypothetical protein [Dolichospermum sp. DET67]MBS3040848.1 hypothetical protein [Dolichospermum sp. DET50]QSX67960.1 MAG: hypothetical protein EZY12_25620 [Dolichospermum sp. DET69]
MHLTQLPITHYPLPITHYPLPILNVLKNTLSSIPKICGLIWQKTDETELSALY